jgi:hypothetical protein
MINIDVATISFIGQARFDLKAGPTQSRSLPDDAYKPPTTSVDLPHSISAPHPGLAAVLKHLFE